MLFSLAASAFSAVVSAVSSLGPAIASACATIAPRILPVIRTAVTVLHTVAKVAEAFSVTHGVLKQGETIGEIGDRALQAPAHIRPEKFDDFDDYMRALRQFDLDPEKSRTMDPEVKFLAGLGIVGAGLDHKMRVRPGTMVNLWSLMAAPDYFTKDRLEAITAQTREIANVIKYFEGDLMPAESMRMENLLLAAEKTLAPHKSDDDCRATLNQVAAQMRAAAK